MKIKFFPVKVMLVAGCLFLLSFTDAVCQEMVVINDTVEWDMSSTHGFNFYFPEYIENLPQNWETPYNYANGQFYTRYEVLESAGLTPCGLQFGIWQQRNDPAEGEKDYAETMADIVQINDGVATVYNNSSPSDWWKSYEGVDFSRVEDFLKLGINIWSLSPRTVISPAGWGGSNDIWENRDVWFPIKIKVIVVAVAEGHVFSGWQNYENQMVTGYNDITDILGKKLVKPFHIDIVSSGIINIQAIQKMERIQVINMQGQVLLSEFPGNNVQTYTLDLSRFNSGTYIVTVYSNKKYFSYSVSLLR